MDTNVLLACGNCAYYALWLKFPPTASWVVIFPVWFLLLSAGRTWTGKPLAGIPTLYSAIPLVLIVVLLAPATVGPALGFWIPVCCVIGTWSGIRRYHATSLGRTLIGLTAAIGVSLVAFGAFDYRLYHSMSAAEKARFRPCWVRYQERQREAGRLPPPGAGEQTPGVRPGSLP